MIPNPFTRPLDVTTSPHPLGYHYTYDEVQNATMRAAAAIFRGGLLSPAPNPTKFIFGRKSLQDPSSMDYAGSYGSRGMDMLQTTYQYGARIQIDPHREDDEVIGPMVPFEDRNRHNPYTPTPSILFDWKKGYLSLDALSVAAFTGSIAPHGNRFDFKNGVKLRDVRVLNPEGIADPMSPEENFIAFSLQAHDGLPFAETRKASLVLMSTSFNTGFQMGEPPLKSGVPRGTVAGGLPVLVARVGATIEAPALNAMKFTAYDWNRKPIVSGTVEGGIIPVNPELPIYVMEFIRPSP